MVKRGWKFCGKACRTEQFIRDWRAGIVDGMTKNGVVSRLVRAHLIRVRGEKCERCGWSEIHSTTGRVPLQVHHVDGTARSTEDNLQLLCPNCHSLTDNYGALNAVSRKV